MGVSVYYDTVAGHRRGSAMTNGKEQFIKWVKRVGRMPENRNIDLDRVIIPDSARRQMYHTAYPQTVKGEYDD